jgi:hypothetical protein
VTNRNYQAWLLQGSFLLEQAAAEQQAINSPVMHLVSFVKDITIMRDFQYPKVGIPHSSLLSEKSKELKQIAQFPICFQLQFMNRKNNLILLF